MYYFKKIINTVATISFLATPFTLKAADSTYTYGNGYCEYRTVPHTCAAWVFGAAGIAAIIAIAVQNSKNEHTH